MNPRSKRAITVAVAALALVAVAYMVPLRDRTADPLNPSAKVSVVDNADDIGGCTLISKTGDQQLGPAACAALVREPGLLSTVRRSSPLWIVLLALVYFLGTVFWALRWRSLLTLARVQMSFRAAWRAVLEAQAGGVLLPGGVGGDALRIASVGTEQGNVPKVAASVFLDRVIGLVTMCLTALIAGVAGGGLSGLDRLMIPLIAIPAGFVTVWTLLQKTNYAGSEAFAQTRLGKIFTPMLAYAREPGGTLAVIRATGLSFLVSITQLSVIRGLAIAFGAHPTHEGWVFAGAAFTFMVNALPALPGGWGTGDAAFVFFLGRAGITPSESLAICLIFRMFWYLTAVVGAALTFVKRRSH